MKRQIIYRAIIVAIGIIVLVLIGSAIYSTNGNPLPEIETRQDTTYLIFSDSATTLTIQGGHLVIGRDTLVPDTTKK